MKIGRFYVDGKARAGVVEGDKAIVNGVEKELGDLVFLPPCVPSKIVCVGLNYADHARELGMRSPLEPLIFLKPVSSLLAHGGRILIPDVSRRVDFEAELAVVIGKRCRRIKVEDAADFILGFTCFNDVTDRSLQDRDGQWTRAKGFDSFGPAGPWISTVDEFSDFMNLNLDIGLRKNDVVMQSSNTENLIFSVPFLVEFISNIMTLQKGDIISTGTPPGVGAISEGDVVEVEIEGIGTLRNQVGLDRR